MATINFFASNKAERKNAQENTVVLTKHEIMANSTEYYSYINAAGEEVKYNGSITKKGNEYYGKIIEQHKVMLTYHAAVAHVDGVPAYYSYMNENGEECKYNGVPLYNSDTMTYTGVIDIIGVQDTIIDIFPNE